MRIFDCTTYYDEELMMDIRFNTLNDQVEKFIVVESLFSHSGNKKKLNFDIKNFQKFKNKIDYIIVDKPPTNILEINPKDSKHSKGEKLILNGMSRDYFQRENLERGLKNLSDNDLILISDLDEIPNLKNLNFAEIKNNIVIFEQKIFYYKLNLFYGDYAWFGTKGTRKKNFLSPQWLRNVKSTKYPKWRIDTVFSKKKYSNLIFIKNGGWHFTCLKTAKELEKKLLNFAHHYEFETSGLKINDIEKMIKEKRVIYDHNVDQKSYKWSGKSKLKKIDKDLLPEYVNLNLEKFDKWLE